ncbi:hypothetical protein DSM112329_01162 [Paraconexibacter sp. AEG42_29]|uniref:RDD domain-containing protein n=1 Tax=Paraconexibacter sp. AEG42_29 TaxID=2997339 RepID=A0AAU7ARP8_9ACTN
MRGQRANVESPALALAAAPWGRRALALGVDGLLYAIVTVLAFVVTIIVLANGSSDEDAAGTGLTALLVFAVTYPWLLLGLWGGRTVGRRVAGVRVVGHDGRPVGIGRAFVREVLVKGVFGVLVLPLLASVLWPLRDPHQRALHDLVAGTRVVRDRS